MTPRAPIRMAIAVRTGAPGPGVPTNRSSSVGSGSSHLGTGDSATVILSAAGAIPNRKSVILSGVQPWRSAVEGSAVAFPGARALKPLALALFLCVLASALAQQPNSTTPVVLDRVVAVVNKHAILSSDIDDEIRLSVLDPNLVGQAALTRRRALEQLISRALIDQQIREQDMQSIEPSQDLVNARLNQMRTELPACVRQNCATAAGWNAFLGEHGLTPDRVESYLRYRLEILSFIEQRFRQGIQISPQQIDSYYHDILLPQYAPGEAVPPLNQVAPRIQEILLERQVNVLFGAWLTNLRSQGDVEVLDPTLESAATPGSAAGADPGASP